MPQIVFTSPGAASVIRNQEQLNRAARELQEVYRKDTQEAQKLERAAKRIYEGTRTPQEQMKARINQLRKAIKEGVAPPEAITALERLKSKHTEMTTTAVKNADKVKESSKKIGDANEEAFGDESLSQLGAWSRGLLAVVGPSSALAKSFREIAAEREKLALDARTALVDEGSLAQLANSPEEFRTLLAESRGLFASGVGTTRDEAARTLFSLISADVSDANERATFGRFRASGLVGDVGGFARSARTLLTSVGEDETGGFIDIASKAFAASAFSPASAEALLSAAARGGTGAAQLGVRDEELLAATALLATATGSAELGGTQVASLLKQLDKAGGFEGVGLPSVVEGLQQRVGAGENIRDIIGDRAEAINAFRVLAQNLEQLQTITTAIDRGQADQFALQKLAIAESADPSLRAARTRNAVQQGREAARTDEATFENLRQSFREADRASFDDAPLPFRVLGQSLVSLAELTDTFRDPETFVREEVARVRADPGLATRGDRAVASEAEGVIQSLDNQTSEQQTQTGILEKQTEVLESMDRKLSEGGLVVGAG